MPVTVCSMPLYGTAPRRCTAYDCAGLDRERPGYRSRANWSIALPDGGARPGDGAPAPPEQDGVFGLIAVMHIGMATGMPLARVVIAGRFRVRYRSRRPGACPVASNLRQSV